MPLLSRTCQTSGQPGLGGVRRNETRSCLEIPSFCDVAFTNARADSSEMPNLQAISKVVRTNPASARRLSEQRLSSGFGLESTSIIGGHYTFHPVRPYSVVVFLSSSRCSHIC